MNLALTRKDITRISRLDVDSIVRASICKNHTFICTAGKTGGP
jgi:hypothetical protein